MKLVGGIRCSKFCAWRSRALIAQLLACTSLGQETCEILRSDNVDFQRGELEWNGRNLYFDQYSHALDWKEIPPSP